MNENIENNITSILIVDDRSENLIAMEAVLRRKSYKIDKANCGQDAIEKVLQFEYDCI